MALLPAIQKGANDAIWLAIAYIVWDNAPEVITSTGLTGMEATVAILGVEFGLVIIAGAVLSQTGWQTLINYVRK